MGEATSTDEELLERWRGGHPSAGAALFERHYDAVARFFANKVGLDCADLVQATFLGCVEGLPRFRGDASFRTLLFAIARNQLLYHLRKQTRERERFSPQEHSVADLQPSVGALIGLREEQRLLLEALRRLPVETQLILELHYWEQLKVREIAAVLELPQGTVKTRLYQGRRQLEQLLTQLADSPELLASTLGGLEDWAQRLRGQLAAAQAGA